MEDKAPSAISCRKKRGVVKTTEASQTRSVTAVVWSGAPVQHQHQAGTATGEGAEGGEGVAKSRRQSSGTC